MKNVYRLTFILLFNTTLMSAVEASLYRKCHLIFLKKPPRNTMAEKSIEKQKKECLKLINKAKLFERNKVFTPKSKEGEKILSTFVKFHRSWFSRFNLNSNTADHANSDLFDINEVAYAITFNLFSQKKDFAGLFEDKQRVVAKRKKSAKQIYLLDKDIWGKRFKRWDKESKWKVGSIDNDVYDFGKEYFWKPELIEVGSLYGFITDNGRTNKQTREIGSKKTDVYINEPLGGGIIGSIPYLLSYSDHLLKKNDGVKYMQRRWVDSIVRELMCRKMPVLSVEEAQEFVVKKSSETFFQDSKCMRCHATLDYSAATIRNYSLEVMGDDLVHKTNKAFVKNKTSTTVKKIGLYDEEFYRSKPEGRFIYKDTEGKVYNKEIKSINDFGGEIADNIDTYKCFASKYIYLFTGRKIDIENPKEELSEKEFGEYNSIVNNFYKKKRLDSLLKDVVLSGFFK